MPAIEIDQNMMNEIIRLKEVVRGSVGAVMDGNLTAAHLASDVHALLDLLDMLEKVWRGAQQAQEPAPEAAQPEQPPPEAQQ